MMYTIAITLFATLFALIAWKRPSLALSFLIAAAPLYLLRFSLVGIPSTALEGMIVILFLTTLGKMLVAQQSILATLSRREWLCVSVFLVTGVVSVLAAPKTIVALGLFKAYVLDAVMVFWLIRQHMVSVDDWERTLRWLGGSVIFIVVFCIFQAISGFGIPAPWDIEHRATGVFDYPNAVGLWVTPIVSLFIARRKTMLSWMVIGAGFLAIFLAQTEAAMVALVMIAAITVVQAQRKRLVVAVTGLAVGMAIVVSVPVVREKIMLNDWSGQARRVTWSESLPMLMDHWMFGAGLGGYPEVMKEYHRDRRFEIFQYPHTLFLNIWTEFGVAGVVAALSLGYVIARRKTEPGSIAQAAQLGLLAMCIHGLVDVPFFKNDLMVLAVFLTVCALRSEVEALKV